MNLQVFTLGRAIKYCRLGIKVWPALQLLVTGDEKDPSGMVSSASSAVTVFAWFRTVIMPGFLYHSPKPAGQFCYLFLSLLPLPHLLCLAFSKGICRWAHKKTDHLSAAVSLQLTRARQTKGRSQDTSNPVITSSHTRQSLHLSCNLYYSFSPVKR